MPLTAEEIEALAARWRISSGRPLQPLRIHTDTSDFFGLEYNDAVLLGGRAYLIRQNAKEGRFGLDDEVKHWVKKAIELDTGRYKFIKLVFYEKFMAHVGGIAFECFRSPKKEARILRLVQGHPNFMQGFGIEDAAGNTVRVLDQIYGKPLSTFVENLELDHQRYFHDHLPLIMDNFIECTEAVRFLHQNGEKHGDIRRDHILIDRETEKYRWIDFDFSYRHRENIYGYDLFGLGNILIFLVGKGDVTLPALKKRADPALDQLSDADLNIVFHNRVANLRKLFPYVPEALNRVLMHFSKGAHWFYEHTGQLLEDLGAARGSL